MFAARTPDRKPNGNRYGVDDRKRIGYRAAAVVVLAAARSIAR